MRRPAYFCPRKETIMAGSVLMKTELRNLLQTRTMRNLRPLFALLGCLMGLTPVFGQQDPFIILTARDSLFLTVKDGKKIVHHTVHAKQTLFSLSKFYSISLEDLYNENPQFRTDPTLYVGSKIRIPVPNRAIKRYKTKNFTWSKNTPIYYVVQNGDNLFQICKRYFSMPVDSIVKRNKLKDNAIRPGQLLQVGWMGTEGVLAEWRPVKAMTQSGTLKVRYEQEKKKHSEVNTQGVCAWPKDSKEKGDLYALHRDAAIGTILAVTNPMYNTTIYAKVIGRIPDGYGHNIEIIISPEAARKLGAKDPRFFVKLKYLK